MRRTLLTSASALALALSSPLRAQASAPADQPPAATPAASRSTSYDAAFFAQYAPRTALDIVRRIPGFTLDLGNTDLRGFSGAAGNVVIDGQRPSSKSETLETLLSRIPASRVVRVDVGSGDLYGAEYSSKAQVANVILSKNAGGLAGNAQASGTRYWFGKVVPNGSASVQFSRGPSTFSLAGDTAQGDYTEKGTDHVTALPGGELLEFRQKVNHTFQRDPYISGGWALEQGDNKSVHVNARFQPSRFTLRQVNHVTPDTGPERDDTLHEDYRTRIFEVGGDITRPLAGGGLKFVALANRRKRTTFDDYLFRGLGGSPVEGGFVQDSESKLSETLGKLSWARSNLGGFSVEAGAEVAYNKLDYALDFSEIEPGGGLTPIPLPLEDATVSEIRGEAYANAGKSLTKTLRADVGLRYETSKLKVRGDATADRALSFWKPSLTLDWQPGNDWHTQFIVRRTVAQLDFYDFVSVAQLSSGQVSGGNANLVPQRTWETRLSAEHPLFGAGKARLELGYDLVSLLQDRVLIFDENGDAFDSPGNLGTGKRMYVDLTLDAPLDRLWKGLRASANVNFQHTKVKDPVSGTIRRWSQFFPEWQWNVDLRRDAGRWAYGVTVADRDAFYVFFTDEIDAHPNSGPYGEAFVEYRPNARSSMTLRAENIFDTGGSNIRRFYSPNHTTPEPDVEDNRFRNSHVRFTLAYKLSFGGKGGVAK